MDIKNYVLIKLLNDLSRFESRRLPQKISYAIIKNIMVLKQEYVIYEKQLKNLIDSYADKCVKDKNGNITFRKDGIPVIKDEHTDEFNKELSNLLNSEVEVDMYRIDSENFNYQDESKYDALTPEENMLLISILCD